jgi:hypothetical protein
MRQLRENWPEKPNFMSKFELGFLIRTALKHALEQQQKLLQHKNAVQWLPVIQQLAKFHMELEEWYFGKYHLNDLCSHFLKEAERIETEADCLSKSLWQYAPVSLTPVFQKIQDRRVAIKNQEYPKQLRAQFNNFRLALLEQISGARLLENNSDLGEELERILLQYFERRFGRTVRILRGGHIYDYANNRSGQIDIIITPTNALGFCPADTGDGKYNVMIDQVIAAISVTSRLTADSFRKRIKELQAIPQFDQSASHFPSTSGQKWPLCYIIGADCDDLTALKEIWEEIESLDKSPLQMVIMLDSGYIRAWSFYAKEAGSDVPIKHACLRPGTDVSAGLGLAWLEAQIAQQNCIWANQSSDWVGRFIKQLHDLEVAESLLTYDTKRNRHLTLTLPFHGILYWGWIGKWIHNTLYLNSIRIGPAQGGTDTTLTDSTKPTVRTGVYQYDFEPRWFNPDVKATSGDYCALEEWIDAADFQKHRRRIVVFDGRTGQEVTQKLPRQLNECSEIEQIKFGDFGL